MLREVPIRMFSSLAERINVLSEPKVTPDVSTGLKSRAPTYLLPNNSSSEHRTSLQLWHVVYLHITLLRYFNFLW